MTDYRFVVGGQLSERALHGLTEVARMHYEDENTVLHADLQDQSAVFGFMARLSDMGLSLVEMQRGDAGGGGNVARNG